MFNANDLNCEIDEVIEATVGKKPPDWITEVVMQRHNQPDGEDRDFYLVCARGYVRSMVGKRLGRAKLSTAIVPDEQLVLPGFTRVQKEYLIEEEGVTVSIPIDDMTDEQIAEKEAELTVMGTGCFEHAAELQRYRLARAASREQGAQS
ncbi:hypothetical protein G3N95_24070 [Paraburkholderia sp. Tr-20389]|uniref:hypothetical protein n=1 Tax=Paraburkholderia sp. Tr-20389 TaxID=2703903 RepID=UPI00197D7A79|nr:hypothetical protein [Paraburkholderia sp. Tr-20389]MBN3756040.1 hypothetical protein [Paraburkholderia sp. Tr-20389]